MINEIYEKLKSLGFEIDSNENRIDSYDIIKSFLVQCGIHIDEFVFDHQNATATYTIINAMKKYGGKYFDIKNITSGYTSFFELNAKSIK